MNGFRPKAGASHKPALPGAIANAPLITVFCRTARQLIDFHTQKFESPIQVTMRDTNGLHNKP